MQRRWFHRPTIHSPSAGHERKVGWLELFYDLIYVATLIQVGNALANNLSVEGFLGFAGVLFLLWLTWTAFTFYANRFVVDDFPHRVLVFMQMFCIGGLAVSIPRLFDGDTVVFPVFYGATRTILVVLYARTYFQLDAARAMTGRYAVGFGVGALVWWLSAAVPAPWVYLCWAIAGVIDLTLPFSRAIRAQVGLHPPDVLHMSERYGLLTLIVLGESFVKSLTSLADAGATADSMLMGGFALVIVCSMWWIYFDDVAGARIKRRPLAPWMWIYSHMPLTIAVTAVGVSLKKAIFLSPMLEAGDSYRWLLCGSLGLALSTVAAIDSVTERRQAELGDRARVNVRLVSSFLIILLVPTGAFFPAWAFLAMVAAVCLGQVIFDLSMAPLAIDREQLEEDAQDVFARAPQLDEVAEAKLQRPPRRDVTEAVRRGTPSELRRDLYFHFMEGSWTRVFVSLLSIFVLLNGVFAALYLLEPGSVTGVPDESFPEAFFFSVQTMSTIGYGVMAPASTYAHVLVTVEAVLALFFAALATGLMFAKASRPRASVLFSRPVIITEHDGAPTLMFRAGNARGNDVVEATVRVVAAVDEVSPEGYSMRRLRDLELVRAASPLFSLSWTVMHKIDENSPLHGVDPATIDDRLAMLVVAMTGHDATYAQTTFVRHVYYPEDVRFDCRFVDVMHRLDDGRVLIDYVRFHDTEPQR